MFLQRRWISAFWILANHLYFPGAVPGMKWLSVLVLSCLLLHLLIDELVDHTVRCRRKTLLGCKLIDLWYDASVSKGGRLTQKRKQQLSKGKGRWSRKCKKLTLVDHGAFASLLEPTQEASAAALAASASTLTVVVVVAAASTLVVVTTVAHVSLVAATQLAFSGLLAFLEEVIHGLVGQVRGLGFYDELPESVVLFKEY
jgi:hypothetical protein